MTEQLTKSEFQDVVKKLKQKEVPGPGGITNKMLKRIGYETEANYSKHHQSQLALREVSIQVERCPYYSPIFKKDKDKKNPESY